MTLETAKSQIRSLLEDNGYREIAQAKTAETGSRAFNNKSYSLKLSGFADEEISSSGQIGCYVFMLEVIYNTKDGTSAKRDIAESSFDNLLTALYQNADFNRLVSNASLQDMTEKDAHVKGTIEFYYGVKSC